MEIRGAWRRSVRKSAGQCNRREIIIIIFLLNLYVPTPRLIIPAWTDKIRLCLLFQWLGFDIAISDRFRIREDIEEREREREINVIVDKISDSSHSRHLSFHTKQHPSS